MSVRAQEKRAARKTNLKNLKEYNFDISSDEQPIEIEVPRAKNEFIEGYTPLEELRPVEIIEELGNEETTRQETVFIELPSEDFETIPGEGKDLGAEIATISEDTMEKSPSGPMDVAESTNDTVDDEKIISLEKDDIDNANVHSTSSEIIENFSPDSKDLSISSSTNSPDEQQASHVSSDNIKNTTKETDETVIAENKPLKKPAIDPKAKVIAIRYEALAFKEKGDVENFERKLIEGLSYDDMDVKLLEMLGTYYFSLQKYNKALPILKKIIELDTENHHTLWQMGYISYEKGEIDAAVFWYEKALSIKNDTKYLMSLADVYYEQKEYSKAIDIIQKAISLKPTNSNYLLALGALYEEIGDTESASYYYHRSYEADPENDLARRKIF